MACSCLLTQIFGALLAIFLIVKVYLKLTTGWCYSYTCLVGKTAIVTGANTGIGYYTALDFAKRGGRVILACRDKTKAEEARRKIVEATGNENVVVKILDLASFASVRAFAKDINTNEKRLDILVNNAGMVVLNAKDKRTEDNLELTMQANHYSHFLLTILLIGLLKKLGPSRIINVSSDGANKAQMDISRIEEYPGGAIVNPAYYLLSTPQLLAYYNSKLCNVLFTQELARRLRGTNVTAYSLHPGVIKTEFLRDSSGFIKIVEEASKNTLMKTAEEGAQTQIYTALEKGIEKYSGEHFIDCKKVSPYDTAKDEGLAKKLWEKSEVLVKLMPEEITI